MWMDIAILAIILASTILGYTQGFTRTFLHTVGWFLAIVLSFVWYPAVVNFLKEKTEFYGVVQHNIAERLAEGVQGTAGDGGTLGSGIPDILMQAFQAASEAVTNSIAEGVAGLLFNIIGFLLIIGGIKLIFWLLIHLFSKKKNGGVTGWFDGIFGAIFGGVKGIVIVLILLALLVPVSELSSGAFFSDALDGSKLAGILYNSNPVLMVIEKIL